MVSKSLEFFSFFLLLLIIIPIISSHEVLGNDFKKQKSPFPFLKNLQGYRKGDKAEGILHVKTYLKQYGYLSNVIDNETFDDLLESSIKTYQRYYNLNISGILDVETLDQMDKPRCGVPDFFNDTNGNSQSHDNPPFHLVFDYVFYPGNPKWPSGKRHLKYALIHNFPSFAIEPLRQAFSNWASASNGIFSFERTLDEQSADIKASFERRDHGDGSPFDGRGGIAAHAFRPTDGRVHFDADEAWTVGAVPNQLDIVTIATHEIGHILGLAHTPNREAIMYAYSSLGTTKFLHKDDIDGLLALYK